MSKPLKAFREAMLKDNLFRKVFSKHTPGKRIAPPQSGNNDTRLQLRLDAGEVIDGKKKIYLQVNSQAKSEVLSIKRSMELMRTLPLPPSMKIHRRRTRRRFSMISGRICLIRLRRSLGEGLGLQDTLRPSM